MAKIIRKTAKIFGLSAGAVAGGLGEFGSFAASSPAYSTDPAVIQSLSAWLSGWSSAIVGAESPAIEDMNGLCYVLAYQIAYGLQAGIPEYDSGTTYYIGSIVSSNGLNALTGTYSVLYISIADSNTGNALTNPIYWKIFKPGALNPQALPALATRAVSTWVSESPSEANPWNSIVWSPELAVFVAAASTGTHRIMKSPDGINWTNETAAEANPWTGICWSPQLGIFVNVATSGTHQVQTSPDGATWSTQTASEANQWESVCWSPELALFVAVAANGTHRVMTSPDGSSWTNRTSVSQTWSSVCWAGSLGLFVAVSTDGHVMTSPDGSTWTSRTAAQSYQWSSICWSPDRQLLVAVASDNTHSNTVMYSADGINWVSANAGEQAVWHSVAWSPDLGVFVAVAGVGTDDAMYSFDGVNWTAVLAANVSNAVTWSPKVGIFCGVGSSNAQISTYVKKFIY